VAADCPVSDDLILLASELATNAILHSQSGHPDRTFTVRATLYPGDYAWVEVIDLGGVWIADEFDDEHGRGLATVAAIAGDGNWGVGGDAASRTAWFRLNWRQDPDERAFGPWREAPGSPLPVMGRSWLLAAVTA
jgi:anti-sigma regulatory factor (Ser/Thr protein kinase)